MRKKKIREENKTREKKTNFWREKEIREKRKYWEKKKSIPKKKIFILNKNWNLKVKKLKLQRNWNFEKIETLTKFILSGKPYLLDIAGVYRILCFIHAVLYTLTKMMVKQIKKMNRPQAVSYSFRPSVTDRKIYNVGFREEKSATGR